MICNAKLNKNNEFRYLSAQILHNLPGLAEYIGYLGAKSADKKSMLSLMKKGTNICFVPGGFEEATIFEHQKHKIFIKSKKGNIEIQILTQGFVKYAL